MSQYSAADARAVRRTPPQRELYNEVVVWWSGVLVVWWSGGLVVWWFGGLVVWWSEGLVVRWYFR